MSGETMTLARFVSALEFDHLPSEVVERTRLLVMDHFGIALRARHAADLNPSICCALEALGLSSGQSSVIGDSAGYAPPAAAFYNGNLAHSLDFDDTHARGSIHPSAPIVPAALAAGEMTGASGHDLINAIVAGYESQIRISIALGPTAHYLQGFHPTATCGAFGAAAAAGRLFGLGAESMSRAFGLVGSQAAGSMQFLADGAWNKPFHTGYAAMNGLIAATMAREGFFGTAEALEGHKGGFLKAYAPDPDPTEVVAELGQRYETMEIAVKPYPSCRYGHAAMDALIALRAANQIDFKNVDTVDIGLPRTGWNLIGDPEAAKQSPKNYVDGQFSMPFVAAVALREGGMVWDDYARHLDDEQTLRLCQRVHANVDDRCEAVFPDNMSGVARITTSSGESFEEMVVTPKGEPANFLTTDEMRAKFNTLVAPYLNDARRASLADALLRLDSEIDVKQLLAWSRPASEAELRVAHSGE